ncbi:hypothetical protein ACTWQL_20775 [Pseudalkalibacillus sp. R45]|uniref:hypothetical protein n=1 Tax=Pseudalkalibacillus sp. R45 TaxID=3457433 RepID=UPI003FCE5EA5
MPCEEIIQVVGTLIPQDKESCGSVTSQEENAIFIFEESRTLLSNQLAQGEFLKMTQKPQSFRKEPSENEGLKASPIKSKMSERIRNVLEEKFWPRSKISQSMQVYQLQPSQGL